MINDENIKANEQGKGEGNHEITGEIEVFSTHCDDDDDDVINLDDNSPSNNEEEFLIDDDPGFVIVTEDKGTNCPSINGSLRKENKGTNVPSVNGTSSKGSMESDSREQIGEEIDSSLPPTAPKRQNKRWSKLMKYTLPSKNPDPKSPKTEKEKKERKSLKDKMKENDFVVFLTERRAVSESRFRVLDKIGSPGKLVRTKSDQSVDESWNTGISTGTITDLKSRFESHDEELIFDLQSPTAVKEVMATPFDEDDVGIGMEEDKSEKLEESKEDISDAPAEVEVRASTQELSKSSGSSTSKINESSPDSGNDDKKAKHDKKGGKKSKEKKEKKKPCEVCTTEKEHREHRKEKKRAKKERQERKREKEASMNNLNKLEKEPENVETTPIVPPYPNGYSSEVLKTKVNGENFFQKLLIKDEIEKSTKMERPSRPVKKEKKPVYKPSEPALGKYLKGKQAVTDSKFKQYDEFERFVEMALLPKGVIKCEEFNEKKSVFEQPRSSSSLSRVSPRMQSMERPLSSMSNRSTSGDRRSLSLPRPGSAMSQGSCASNSSFIIDQAEYHNYVYEMIHSTQKNPRFNQLTTYFNTLEKVTKLESESANMDIHKLGSEDIVDFETWRQLRKQEKAKDELDDLLVDLRKAQKEREFHFRPKEVDSVKWKGDSRLRGRDKSVENLKSLFTKMGEGDEQRMNSTTLPNKDHYRLYWRPKSVTDLTRDIPSKPLKLEEDRFTTYPRSRNVQSPYNVLHQQRSRSSLSMDQVSSLKNQLNGILSAKNSNASSVQSSRSPSRAENYSIEVKGKGEPNPLQSLGLFVKPIPEIVKKSLEQAEQPKQTQIQPRSKSTEDEERARLSKTINDELLKKVNFQQDFIDEKDTKKKINFDINAESDKKLSPRTCYSLERESNSNKKHDEDNDFILVLSDGEQKSDKLEEIIDKWASGPDSEDETKINEIRKKMKGRLSGFQSSQSSESISSGTSVHTVIFKGVKNKAQYFENMKAEDKSIEPKEDVDTSSKSIDEIRKSFENIKASDKIDNYKDCKLPDDDQVIPPNMVKEMRKSFENMPLPDPPTEEELRESCANSVIDGEIEEKEQPPILTVVSIPPEVPQRSSSYQKQNDLILINNSKNLESRQGSGNSLDKSSPQSKSASSIPDLCKDEGYATFPNSPRKPGRQITYLEKTYIPEKSISNVDLTDNENNSLDETFGKMHEKVHSLGNSGDIKDSEFYGHKSLQYIPEPTYYTNPTKYNRAYLTLSKAGDVKEKLSQFESKVDGKPLRSLPNVDINYIKNNVTDTKKVVIRNQEISDVSEIKSKLQRFENNKDKDLFDYCGAMLTKEKLKHFCKKMGHSKIISKMASLQKSAHVGDDDGFKKLNIKASAETEYISKYRSGEVESKKSVFERNVEPSAVQTEPITIQRIEESTNGSPSFSWSTRFDHHLPIRSDAYSAAQKHNQYRHYFGYHPTEAPSVPRRIDSRMYPPEIRELNRIGSRKPIYQPYEDNQPTSLPMSIGTKFNPQVHQPISHYVPFESPMHHARYDPRMLGSHQYNSGAASLPANQVPTDLTNNCRFGKLTPMPVSRKGAKTNSDHFKN